jgi:hypothetical protein
MSVLNQEELLSLLNSNSIGKFNTKVVGTSFRDKSVIDSVQSDEFFVLLPELGNEHDENAVMVVRNDDGAHVGYISREYNQRIKEQILNGSRFLARSTVTGEGKENKGINLLVIQFGGEPAKVGGV